MGEIIYDTVYPKDKESVYCPNCHTQLEIPSVPCKGCQDDLFQEVAVTCKNCHRPLTIVIQLE